jgi:polyhydroxyalkanoate synthesis repressor PhaR
LQLCSARRNISIAKWENSLTSEKAATATTVVIKKYANRRLYNTSTSTYVTLDDLAQMVKQGTEFAVYDAKTGEDITRSVLTQIIFEEENKGTNLLPINFLRQLIRFYGDSLQAFVPGYLEMSLQTLGKEHDRIRQQIMDAWGTDPLKAMEAQTKRNMAMFTDAMRMFNPFAGMAGAEPGSPRPSQPSPPASQDAAQKNDLQALKDQLSDMQRKIDELGKKS